MPIMTSIPARNAMLKALAELCNDGYVRAYVDAAPDSKMLFECRLGNPAFGMARSGQISAKAVLPEQSASEGQPTWYRVFRQDGRSVVWEGDVSEGGGDGSLQLSHSDIQSGADVTIGSIIYILPE